MTMTDLERLLRRDARTIWDEAVTAVQPARLIANILTGGRLDELRSAPRIVVVGGGKAGAGMVAVLEYILADRLDRVEGVVNVPAECVRPLRRIQLHAARPAGVNFPTADGVAGAEQMLRLMESAGPSDVAVCLISGGGSALLPAPAEGISLADKQAVTQMLHASGATIEEMNAVRKHLSRIKGGGLARVFRGRKLLSLIISDVVGDPLDVIASGPTTADPTTFADALDVLRRYDLLDRAPRAVCARLEEGAQGLLAETLKQLAPNIDNQVIGNNLMALRAAEAAARRLGYQVLNLGAYVEGDTQQIAVGCAGIVRSVLHDRVPISEPACLLVGGETTVALGPKPGRGGRNQEFVLAMVVKLDPRSLANAAILSGGTDGEDGPTDAAGAIAGSTTLAAAARLGLNPSDFLAHHDAYSFFDATGDLIRTGLTGTNVMDVRVILVRSRTQ
jgi:hydroxypyruvate reductase/glycerate 2-kinase